MFSYCGQSTCCILRLNWLIFLKTLVGVCFVLFSNEKENECSSTRACLWAGGHALTWGVPWEEATCFLFLMVLCHPLFPTLWVLVSLCVGLIWLEPPVPAHSSSCSQVPSLVIPTDELCCCFGAGSWTVGNVVFSRLFPSQWHSGTSLGLLWKTQSFSLRRCL